jgi:integrase
VRAARADLDPCVIVVIVGERRVDAEDLKTDRPRLKSWDEVMKLADALDGSAKTAYLLCARAGLRPGEAVALTWGDVDLEARQITVSREAPWADEVGPIICHVARKVPIVERLANHLASIRPTPRADNALVCPAPRRKKRNGTVGGLRVHLGPKSIRAALARAFKAAGIAPAEFDDYGRHTFAALAALGGAPAWRLQEVLGHADIAETLIYVSLRDPLRTGAEPASLGA